MLIGIIAAAGFGSEASAQVQDRDLGNLGRFAKWERIEVAIHGPDTSVRGTPNPFDKSVDFIFLSPDQRRFRLPGYYAGDGAGGEAGNIWKARFSADMPGEWTLTTESAETLLDGYEGSFFVGAPDEEAEGFWKSGRLEYTGTEMNGIRYHKFRDGSFYLKAGCNVPENFLGNFSNFDTMEKRVAAIDYMARRGVNALYIMTHNIEGDHRDVWPWLGESEAEAKANAGRSARFDVRRLDRWQDLFEYMQRMEVVPHLVLEDDSSWKGYDYKRYYREMVARFSYLPALLFNLGEEFQENYFFTIFESSRRAKFLRSQDPFAHSIGVHNINTPKRGYIKNELFSFASIQTEGEAPLQHNALAIKWINAAKKHNVRIPTIGFDEPRPEMDRKGWWAAYMGGAVWEIYITEPYNEPYESYDGVWRQLGGARAFMETLPFWKMTPANEIILNGAGFCLAAPEEVYAFYFPDSDTKTLVLPVGKHYRVQWWRPENDRSGSFIDGGRISSPHPRVDPPGPGDWALRLTEIDP